MSDCLWPQGGRRYAPITRVGMRELSLDVKIKFLLNKVSRVPRLVGDIMEIEMEVKLNCGNGTND